MAIETVQLGFGLTVTPDEMRRAAINLVECAIEQNDPPVVFEVGGLRELMQMIGIMESPPAPTLNRSSAQEAKRRYKEKLIAKQLAGEDNRHD